MHESHKVPAYVQVCIEIDPHSLSACTRLTEICTSSARLYGKCNNNVFDHSVSYTEIFSTINMCLLVKYEHSAEPLSVLYYYLIDVVVEIFTLRVQS